MGAALSHGMRNTELSIIDFAALGSVIGGFGPKQAQEPAQQQTATAQTPEEDGVTVEVATGAQAAQRIAALTGGAAGQPATVQRTV